MAERRAPRNWRKLPEAKLDGFEAISEFDKPTDMEFAASPDEVARLLGPKPPPYLVFPDDREHPIRMTDDPPLRWVETGPSRTFEGTALRGEFYAFQLGVFANQALEDVRVSFGRLSPVAAGFSLRPAGLG